MFSNLANALIRIPRTSSKVSDLIWRYSDIRNIENPLSAPTQELVKEYYQVGDLEILASIAKKIPSTLCLEYLLSLDGSKKILAKALENPCASLQLLQTNNVKTTPMSGSPNLASFEMHKESEAIEVILGMRDYEVHNWFKLLTINKTHAADLLLFNHIEKNRVVDATMAQRVISGSNELTELALSHIKQNENGYPLTTSAEKLLIKEGFIKDPTSKYEDRNALDAINSYRLAGMGDFEILPLILANDKIKVNSDEIIKLISSTSDHNIVSFILGGFERKPRNNEVLAILKNLEEEKLKAVADEVTGNIETSPYADELVLGLPTRNYEKLGTGSITLIDNYITKIICDEKSWEVLLAMSQEWEGSLDTLLKAADLL